MKEYIINEEYDRRLIASDWRYSAAIVGLKKYFDFHQIAFFYDKEKDYIEYNNESIDENKYFKFVEYFYLDYMHHRIVEDVLMDVEDISVLSEAQIKLVDEKLKANVPMKKFFPKLTYEDNIEILDIIKKNRTELTRETYRNGIHLYRKYSNTNALLKEDLKTCRLNGYNVDAGRKTKSISYMNDYSSFVYEDHLEFDFIPFAFTKSSEGVFINNNYNLRALFQTSSKLEGSYNEHKEEYNKNTRELLFNYRKESSSFINFDVEVIVKDVETNYYKTLFIRKPAIKIFEKIKNYKSIMFSKKLGKDYYLDIQKAITESIINLKNIDYIIETLLKEKWSFSSEIIRINSLIYGGESMDDKMKSAYGTAQKLKAKFKAENKENKITSYRNKLVSAITLKDYDKFCDILLQLSAYSQIPFNFSFDLFEDFEANKNIAYTFVNALGITPYNSKEDDKNE
ncbi:MAG: type I CRISPR-associated protein Cas8a1/Csx8 [Acidaminobacteraceae bacterium]